MRTRSKSYPNNSNATIPRRSNRRRVPNLVEHEIRTIEKVVPMVDRTMEELLQAPTEGYGEAIVIPEILAKNFEIKTNLLQLVQINKFHGFERDNPHTHISNLKRMTSTLKYRDVPNDAIKLMIFSYSLEEAARIWDNSSKTDDRIDKLADQISNLVEIVNNNQPSVCEATGTYNQVSPPNQASNQIPPPGFALIQPGIPNELSSYMKSNETLIRNMQNQINALRGDFNKQEENLRRNLNNDMRSILGIENSFYDPEGDILYLEKLLNDEPFQLPPMDLKQAEETKAKSLIEESPKLELKELPSHLEYASSRTPTSYSYL
nr:reverse transcriptase domain-containing protein [Tanacetum cinerariifolium]